MSVRLRTSLPLVSPTCSCLLVSFKPQWQETGLGPVKVSLFLSLVWYIHVMTSPKHLRVPLSMADPQIPAENKSLLKLFYSFSYQTVQFPVIENVSTCLFTYFVFIYFIFSILNLLCMLPYAELSPCSLNVSF